MTTKTQQNEGTIRNYVERTGKDWMFKSDLPNQNIRTINRCPSVLAVRGSIIYLNSTSVEKIKNGTGDSN